MVEAEQGVPISFEPSPLNSTFGLSRNVLTPVWHVGMLLRLFPSCSSVEARSVSSLSLLTSSVLAKCADISLKCLVFSYNRFFLACVSFLCCSNCVSSITLTRSLSHFSRWCLIFSAFFFNAGQTTQSMVPLNSVRGMLHSGHCFSKREYPCIILTPRAFAAMDFLFVKSNMYRA